MQSFHDLGVPRDLERTLSERGISAPFPIQARVLPHALGGRDVLAKSPTGSGKTLAFAIPIAVGLAHARRRPTALVLVPTRELASQVADELASIVPATVTVAKVYGGTPLQAQAKRARHADVVVATPGRLNDLLDRNAIALDAVAILVLDEADRMLDMGFKPQVDRVLAQVPRKRQTMLFSATLDDGVNELARAYTTDPVRCDAVPRPMADDAAVEHRFLPVAAESKVETLAELLGEVDGLALVFVRTRRGADRLVRKLASQGVDAVAMHGDLSQAQRERALRRFETGQASTLVATDVAARGLDLERITHVINFDPPAEHNGYVHRVGRTGRAGRAGTGVTLVLPEQQADVSRIARLVGHTEQFAAVGMKVAPARRVYSSRRRDSRWSAPRPRRKI